LCGPIEPGDAETVSSFLAAHAEQNAVPACGLIGKLLGELVAVMAIDLGESTAFGSATWSWRLSFAASASGAS